MYCGIDVAKNKSNVCILDNQRNKIAEFEIQHTKAGFEQLEGHLTPNTKIGMEVTSTYCKALYAYLKQKYKVSYVDNSRIKSFIRLHNPHVKNDRADARAIVEYLIFGFKEISPNKVDELKDLCRLYHKTLDQLTRLKFMFSSQVAVIFPELEEKYCIKRTKGVAYLLLKYPTPKDIAAATDKELYEALNEHSIRNHKFTMDFAVKLKQIATDSIGVPNYPVSCFKYTIRLMLFYQSLVDEIKKNMGEQLKETPYARLLDEYGYGISSLSIIVGEIGDVRRFSNHKKFVKYIGLDVSENQSGTSISGNTYITKQGNKYLRNLFYNQVLHNLSYKTKQSEFFYRLKGAGKHAKKAMVATARKIAVKTYYDLMRCHQTQ